MNEKVLAKSIGEEINKADADFVRELTGFAIGGVSPIGHKQKIETYIDEGLLKYKELWAAAET
jgi:prolyl-tRNA editing enzyme YbaK/EbsC (Cys-tRNA(Pro) deacylase)